MAVFDKPFRSVIGPAFRMPRIGHPAIGRTFLAAGHAVRTEASPDVLLSGDDLCRAQELTTSLVRAERGAGMAGDFM